MLNSTESTQNVEMLTTFFLRIFFEDYFEYFFGFLFVAPPSNGRLEIKIGYVRLDLEKSPDAFCLCVALYLIENLRNFDFLKLAKILAENIFFLKSKGF